ncbi:hypothetical protein DFH07DRAFT_935556 [Mycena maculata]|uniref:C2H2-type domain-containing protein n=1 Tax=Mycena maculata TaxID=230809 RepID=A0AAD7P0B9_9AGAR|nr:hypothetical protein DFH07DRAFT_935556 [Mycena maculata]
MAGIASVSFAGVTFLCDTANFFKKHTVGQQLQTTFKNMASCMYILYRDHDMISETDRANLQRSYAKSSEEYRELQERKYFPRSFNPFTVRDAWGLCSRSEKLVRKTIGSSTEGRRQRLKALGFDRSLSAPEEELDPLEVVRFLTELMQGSETRGNKALQQEALIRLQGKMESIKAANSARGVPEPAINLDCRWDGCKERLSDSDALYDHLCDHVPTKRKVFCKWEDCHSFWSDREDVIGHLRAHAPKVCVVTSKAGPMQDSPLSTPPESISTTVQTCDSFSPQNHRSTTFEEDDEAETKTLRNVDAGVPFYRLPSNPEANPWS